MKITVAMRRTEVSEALRQYALDKIEHLNHYFPKGMISVDVVFDAERGRQIVEMVAHLIRKKIIKASGDADNMHAAVDAAVDKLKTQLVRHKDQLQEKRQRSSDAKDSQEINGDPGELQRTQVYLRKPMTPEEAILQLESYQKKDFLIFMDAERQKISVVHRLSNGQYELIEPVY